MERLSGDEDVVEVALPEVTPQVEEEAVEGAPVLEEARQ